MIKPTMQCMCPHIATPTGLTRSGWSIDCVIHRITQPAALSFTGIASDGMGTRIPQYVEMGAYLSLHSIVMHMDKRLIECERALMTMQGIEPA